MTTKTTYLPSEAFHSLPIDHLLRPSVLDFCVHPLSKEPIHPSDLQYCKRSSSPKTLGHTSSAVFVMSFSTLVSDIAFRDSDPTTRPKRPSPQSISGSYARSYVSTTATSVSISGDISSQLHGGYSHPLTRSWQAERQLTKVRLCHSPASLPYLTLSMIVNAHLPTLRFRPRQ